MKNGRVVVAIEKPFTVHSVHYTILDECRALWGERSEAWYPVTVAADAEAATYVKRVYVDYL